jgi:very-short-patch-repair endonuclease
MLGKADRSHREVSRRQRERAKALRGDMTDAERRLWMELRAHRFAGWSFRRQVPIGAYICDFVCHRGRLIIEVDGGQHVATAQAKGDAQRTAWLEDRGFRDLRFWNNDVLASPEGVLTTIAAVLAAIPPSQPSPARGEGFPPASRESGRR